MSANLSPAGRFEAPFPLCRLECMRAGAKVHFFLTSVFCDDDSKISRRKSFFVGKSQRAAENYA